MDSHRSIQILERQKDAVAPLLQEAQAEAFKKWKRDTEVAIERIFGTQSRHVTDFGKIRYHLMAYSTGTPESEHREARRRGLRTAEAVLQSMIQEIKEYEIEGADAVKAPDALTQVERLCLRFHAMARQLQSRHGGRATLEVEDEYDVQDLLHATLRLHFDDIRPEEWSPSYAGSGSRVDFLLKAEGIVIEVKKTRPSLKPGQLGGELIVDIARYARHPDCKTLVCFIYDPEFRIGNPAGLERDLESHDGSLRVRVIVAPKG